MNVFPCSQVWSGHRRPITSWGLCFCTTCEWRTTQHQHTTTLTSSTRDTHRHTRRERQSERQQSLWNSGGLTGSMLWYTETTKDPEDLRTHRHIQVNVDIRATVTITTTSMAHARDSTSVEEGRNVCKGILYYTALNCFMSKCHSYIIAVQRAIWISMNYFYYQIWIQQPCLMFSCGEWTNRNDSELLFNFSFRSKSF